MAIIGYESKNFKVSFTFLATMLEPNREIWRFLHQFFLIRKLGTIKPKKTHICSHFLKIFLANWLKLAKEKNPVHTCQEGSCKKTG